MGRRKARWHTGRLSPDALEALHRARGIALSHGRSETSTGDLLLALVRDRAIRWRLETLGDVDVPAAEVSLSHLLQGPQGEQGVHLKPLREVVSEAISKVPSGLFATSADLLVSAIETAAGETADMLARVGLSGKAVKRAVLGPNRALALRDVGAVYLYVNEVIDRAEHILYEAMNAAQEEGPGLVSNLEAVGERLGVKVTIDSSRRDQAGGIIYQVDYVSRPHADAAP